MFPLGDESRRLRHLPYVTVLIIVLNALMFLVELVGGDAFINRWSLVPANVVAGAVWPTWPTSAGLRSGRSRHDSSKAGCDAPGRCWNRDEWRHN
jgi:hypothetical protein